MKMRLVCLLVLLVGVAWAQDREVGKGVNFYSLEKEAALGKQLAAEFRQRTQPIDNTIVQAYVDGIGQRLTKEIGGPPFHYTFAVIADDPTALHEVAAFPGGFLFVPAELILTAANEDEFAGMLAHAIAHVAARDATRQATRMELVDMASTPLIYMGGWTGFAIQQGQSLAIPLGMVQMWRRSELNADALAARKMAAAGYDPAALARYIERVQPPDEETAKNQWSPLPPRSRRLEAIGAAIGALPPQTYPRQEEFSNIQKEIRRVTPRR